jgi:hypothetical protein
MDSAYQDLYQLRNSDNGRLITVLFNTSTEYDDPRNQYDFITSDKDVVGEQLRILLSKLPANARGSVLLPPGQEYYNNSLLNSRRGLTSNIALAQESILSRSLSPGMRMQSSRRLSHKPSILIGNAEPQVYVMEFNDTGYKQFYSTLPVNYNLVQKVPTSLIAGQKSYLIVPAAMANQVMNSLQHNEPNLRIIVYGEMANAQPHPAVELVSNDI